jgi:diketogulonate reductase-like aldo/keto reductase
MAKFDMLETTVKENILNIGCSNNDIQSMINLIDSATHAVMNQIESSDYERARLSMDDKLWQRNLIEQK